ncbi:hypothetical protein TNCV_1289951 [Trichonephila clavipes]|nr:hypothetical protein TNCV_1289951 [Trichonephila clavipes]
MFICPPVGVEVKRKGASLAAVTEVPNYECCVEKYWGLVDSWHQCNAIEIKMALYKPMKSTPVQDTSDEEDRFEEEEVSYRVLTPTRNWK